jgi:glyoxylase I family protein
MEKYAMDNLQIFHVNINCSNLERSLEFYKLIGFKELLDFNKAPNMFATKKIDEQKPPIEPGLGPALGLPEGSRGRARLLVLGDDPRATRIDLIEWVEPRAEGKPYLHLAHLGIARICFKVKDAWKAYEELKAKGIAPFTEPHETGLGGSRQIFFCCYDSDGTVLEFMEFKKR